jgi:hypothetical protein
MKLDRNINDTGMGKYALLKLRPLKTMRRGTFQSLPSNIIAAFELLEREGILDWGTVGTEKEFFLIRLKDEYAQPALRAYANKARADDPEYAAEVDEMADRAGPASPFCKRPD